MKLSQVVGQTRAKESFLRMHQSGRVAHAQLIQGAEGTGVLPMALGLAQLLLCEKPLENDSCGKCSSCIKVKSLSHPDLLLSYPTVAPKPKEKPSSIAFHQEFCAFVAQTPYDSIFDWLQFINAENKQGNITAEECRKIIEALSMKSYEGGNKILVMWGAEYLGKEGNILLKIMEEPPPNTFIILASTEPEKILATIRSRLQVLRLSPLPAAIIKDALMALPNAELNKASQCAQLAHGNYARALQLFSREDNEFFPQIRSLFNHLFTNNGTGLSMIAATQAENGREQQKNFLQLIIKMMQQSIALKYTSLSIDVTGDEEQFVRKVSQLPLSLNVLYAMIDEMEKTTYLIERNANSRVVLHALFLRLQYLVEGKTWPKFVAH